MRLQIRPEQMSEIQESTEKNFTRRIAAHLLENYTEAMVTLPDTTKMTVEELPKEELDALVDVGIERARSYEMTYESSIAAFCALMFEVAPNFDKHKLSQVVLQDETFDPDARINELLNILNDNTWETIRKTYDPEAWHPMPKVEEIEANA